MDKDINNQFDRIPNDLVLRFRSGYGVNGGGNGSGLPGGFVQSWTDDVLGLTVTAPTSALQPRIYPNMFDSFPGIEFISQRLTYSGRIAQLQRQGAITIYMVSGGGTSATNGAATTSLFGPYPNTVSGGFGYQVKDNYPGNLVCLFANGAVANQLIINNQPENATTNCSCSIPNLGGQISVRAGVFNGSLVGNTGRALVFSNNKTKTETAAGTIPTKTIYPTSTDPVEFNIGAISNTGTYTATDGKIFEIRVYNSAHTTAQMAAVNDELMTYYGIKNRIRVICDGDSITAGTGSALGLGWPKQTELLVGKRYLVFNIGVSGQTVVQMEAKAANQIDTEFGAFPQGDVVIAFGGSNDMEVPGNQVAAYTAYKTYCTNRKAAGYKVIAVTVLPRTSPGNPANYEVDRQAFNLSIRTEPSPPWDVIADVGNDANMGQAGQQSGVNYSGDNLHPGNLGYVIISTYMRDALASLIW